MPKLAILLFAGTLFGQAPTREVVIPADIAGDAYALYSAAYRDGTRCDALKKDELLVINHFALTFPAAVGDRLKPGSDEDREMVRNLIQWTKTPYVWEARFDFGQPYRMLTDAESQLLSDCKFEGKAGHPHRPGCGDYKMALYERAFSVPGFNKDHTRALVFSRRSCGFLCGGDEFTEYRKTAAGWQRVDGPLAAGCTLY